MKAFFLEGPHWYVLPSYYIDWQQWRCSEDDDDADADNDDGYHLYGLFAYNIFFFSII